MRLSTELFEHTSVQIRSALSHYKLLRKQIIKFMQYFSWPFFAILLLCGAARVQCSVCENFSVQCADRILTMRYERSAVKLCPRQLSSVTINKSPISIFYRNRGEVY